MADFVFGDGDGVGAGGVLDGDDGAFFAAEDAALGLSPLTRRDQGLVGVVGGHKGHIAGEGAGAQGRAVDVGFAAGGSAEGSGNDEKP